MMRKSVVSIRGIHPAAKIAGEMRPCIPCVSGLHQISSQCAMFVFPNQVANGSITQRVAERPIEAQQCPIVSVNASRCSNYVIIVISAYEISGEARRQISGRTDEPSLWRKLPAEIQAVCSGQDDIPSDQRRCTPGASVHPQHPDVTPRG